MTKDLSSRQCTEAHYNECPLLKNASQIIETLNEKGSINKKLGHILDILLSYLEVEQGSIMVVEKKELVVAAATRRELIGHRQSLDDDSVAATVAKTAKPIFIPDISQDGRFQSREGANYKKNSLLSAPIAHKNNVVLGVINATDKEGDKDLLKEDITVLLNLSSVIISVLVQQKLEKDLRAQKRKLTAKNKELKKQESLKDELYRMLIHDLKSPLAEVIANLDILSYSIDEENKDFLESAQIACDRTVRMVSNLVSINKIEDGKIKPYKEEVDLQILLKESYSAIKGLAKIKNVELKLEIPEDLPTIYLDRLLILRVLQNLLTNALGHTTEGTCITLGCKKVPGKKRVEFYVQDEGEGISEEKQKVIFDKYSRLTDRQDALVGTGLGLYFCKLAIEVHRGVIGIESAPGQGCRFYFILAL